MLHVVVLDYHEDIPTLNHHILKMLDHLALQSNFDKIGFGELQNKTEDEMRVLFLKKYNCMPDNLFFFEHLSSMGQLNIPSEIKINVYLDDLHHQGQIKRDRLIGIKKVSRIFSTYAYCFHKFYSKTIPVYFLPHSVAFTENMNFNDHPKIKILLSGRLGKSGPSIYPFRYQVHLLSQKDKRIEQLSVNHKYNIKSDSDNLIHGERYIKVLNQYLACFTCDASADRPYIVAKHFEIMSSGSLLLAGNPNTKSYFEKLGFQDGVHYISATMENLNDKIDFILDPDNRELIDTIRKNGYELARQKHTFIQRAQYVIQVLAGMDHSTTYSDGINMGEYLLAD